MSLEIDTKPKNRRIIHPIPSFNYFGPLKASTNCVVTCCLIISTIFVGSQKRNRQKFETHPRCSDRILKFSFELLNAYLWPVIYSVAKPLFYLNDRQTQSPQPLISRCSGLRYARSQRHMKAPFMKLMNPLIWTIPMSFSTLNMVPDHKPSSIPRRSSIQCRSLFSFPSSSTSFDERAARIDSAKRQ